jgi:phosphoserine phosphatase
MISGTHKKRLLGVEAMDRESDASSGVFKSRYALVIFDLDGTLVTLDKSVWQLLHDSLGTDPQERQATLKKARQGEITYDEWFHHDLVMLREAGATQSDVERVLADLKVVEGALDLLAQLRRGGARVAVISGGVKMTLGLALPNEVFDEVFINEIHYDDEGRISGGRSTPYDGAGKARGLEVLAERWNLTPSQIAFVGDGSNDVEIAQLAGYSIAWGDSAAVLKEASNHVVPGPDLRALLPLLLAH